MSACVRLTRSLPARLLAAIALAAHLALAAAMPAGASGNSAFAFMCLPAERADNPEAIEAANALAALIGPGGETQDAEPAGHCPYCTVASTITLAADAPLPAVFNRDDAGPRLSAGAAYAGLERGPPLGSRAPPVLI